MKPSSTTLRRTAHNPFKTMLLPTKSLDKNYLLRLLNGNTEMMSIVLSNVFQNIPHCLNQINSCMQANDKLGVITYASRAKSAFSLIREEQLVMAFHKIALTARDGELSTIREFVSATHTDTLGKLSALKEAV